MRAYLQRYPFVMGPDKKMNALSRQAIQEGLKPRAPGTSQATVTRLLPDETHLTGDEMRRLQQIMDASMIPLSSRAGMIDDFAWEANLGPRHSSDVLVLGCGNGIELMFLRAVLPEARITAIDYSRSLSGAIEQATGVRFFQGDMNDLLAGFGQEFDLISSNHTLEHLYEPNELLTILAGLLREGGSLISALPMDGMAVSPFWDEVRNATANRPIHPADMVYLDAGHPWKTNPTDLVTTIQASGFEKPSLYQRQEHLSRYAKLGEERFRKQMEQGKLLHRIFFNPPRALLKLLFPNSMPEILNRCLLAAERRVWFGTNNLKNRYTKEIFLFARKNGFSLSNLHP
ncbi:MAG TPA: class I SAM-dependent methyltransferase [Granulicella sp.]